MEYSKNDLFERLQRARDGMAEFRKTIDDARENPVLATSRIEEGMNAIRDVMKMALRLKQPTEVVEVALSCARLLRGTRPLFDYLYEHVHMKSSDEDTNEYLLGLSGVDEDEHAVETILSTKAMPPSRLANFIERRENHAGDANLKPVRCKMIVVKLRQLQARMNASKA